MFTLSKKKRRYSESLLQGMCCGMFCLDGDVVFIHSKHVNEIGSSTLI